MDRQDRTDQTLRDRKSRDRAMILPIVGFVLLMPPVAAVFDLHAKLGGLPFTLVYIFLIWVLLIAGAWLMSHRLEDDTETASGPAEREDGA